MAKYYITHTCGHDECHQICGTNVNGEREKKEEWLKTTKCQECWTKENKIKREQEHAAALEIAKKTEEQIAMPDLSGSDKQIAWARSLRAEYIGKVNQSKLSIFIELMQDKPVMQTAKWWIDNRSVLHHMIDDMIIGWSQPIKRVA